MELIRVISESRGGRCLGDIGRRFGYEAPELYLILERLAAALRKPIRVSLATREGFEALRRELTTRRRARYLDSPTALARPAALVDGRQILRRWFGGAAATRAVARRLARDTHSPAKLLRLLPFAAAALMGAIARETRDGATLGSGILGDDLLRLYFAVLKSCGNDFGALARHLPPDRKPRATPPTQGS